MYKRFYLPILLLVSILIAAGCNNSNGNEENSGESNETSAEENNAEKTDKEENGASGHHTDLLTVEGTPLMSHYLKWWTLNRIHRQMIIITNMHQVEH